MKYFKPILLLILVNYSFSAISQDLPPQTEVMTLGVFHFNYPNLDAIKVKDEDKISVLEEPWKSEIIAICKAIEHFYPTIIAVELTPELQPKMDSLYNAYLNYKYVLGKNEVYQLGFRLAKSLNHQKVYCIDDPGRHYENIQAIFDDSIRMKNLTDYYYNKRNPLYEVPMESKKIESITKALINANQEEIIAERLANYLHHPFKYEETSGDFTGVDFETGRWFNRNLRIFRNIQRLPHTTNDRLLLIIGSEHLNLLNYFLDVSKEFKLVSPLPYLENVTFEN